MKSKRNLVIWIGMMFAGLVAGQQVAPTTPRARSVSTVYASSLNAPGGSYVGIYLAEIDGARAKALKLREERGVEVTKVEEDSPAARAGIKVGDVVLDYNGQRVEGIEQFRRFVRETPANRDARLQVSRDGNVQTLVVKVGMRKGMDVAVAPRLMEMPEVRVERPGMLLWSRAALGVEADSIEGQLAAYFGVKEGVLVRSVLKGSAAEKAGLRAGDVIVKVEDRKIANASDLTRAVRLARNAAANAGKKIVPVVVMRDRKEVTLQASLEDEDRSELPELFELPELRRRPAALSIHL